MPGIGPGEFVDTLEKEEMQMGFNVKNFNKSAFRTQITRKQNQFNRFVRRFKASKNAVEKRFLKTEAMQICSELKVFAQQWKNFGFGSCTWVTRNCNSTAFTTTTRKSSTRRFGRKTTARRFARKSYARKGYAKKSYARKSYAGKNSRRSFSRSKARSNNRRFKMNRRTSYTAW